MDGGVLDPTVPADAASDDAGDAVDTLSTAILPPIPTGDMVWATFWMGLDYMLMLLKSWFWTIFCRMHFAKFVWPKPPADPAVRQPWAYGFFQISYLPDDWQLAAPGFRFGTWFLFGCYIRILPVWIDMGLIRARRVPKPVVAMPVASGPITPAPTAPPEAEAVAQKLPDAAAPGAGKLRPV